MELSLGLQIHGLKTPQRVTPATPCLGRLESRSPPTRAWDGMKLTANGMTFGALPNDWIGRDALIREYGNVGRFSEFAGGTATVCLSAAGALKVAGVNPWLGKIVYHGPHRSGPHQFRHLQIMIRKSVAGKPWTRCIPLGPK